jgi:ABC-type transport system involved in multi-copper enzyme maturation permease subunit
MTKIFAIALNTFRESVRDRVLYNLVLFALLLIIASLVLGRIAVEQDTKIIIDVGLSAMTGFGMLISTFLGVGLVSKEIEKRTLTNILSKPVGRSTFLLGKYAGLVLTLLLNAVVMTTAINAALAAATGGVSIAQLKFWPAAYLIFLELAIITAVALLFSCFSSPALSALFTLLIFLIGRWAPDLKLIAETSESLPVRSLCLILYYLTPNLANFNLINEAAHGDRISGAIVAGNSIYAAGYIMALVAASVLIFERRNFE